jgi:acrylyl-CoA reductase (NADPH)
MAHWQQLPPNPPFYALWDARLSTHETSCVDRVRGFCDDVIAPFAVESARSRLPLSKDVVRAWARIGMSGLQTPTELGGQGASYMTKIRVVHEMARRSFACAFSLNNSQSMVHMMATRAPAELREQYLPGLLRGELVASVALTEPSGGSDLAATRTRATKVQGGWRLDGEKAWVANATIADLMVVAAQTATGTQGVARFLVDMQAVGVERLGAHPVAAGHAVGAGGVRFDNVFVEDRCMLEEPGAGFKRAMEAINGARIHVAAMCVAAVEAALGTAARYCSERQAFGKSLLEHQGLRWRLVDVASQLEAANLLVYHGADLVNAGLPSTLPAAHAKKFAASIAVPSIEACMQAMGAQAMMEPVTLARQLAEIKMAAYADGTTEIQDERIGSQLLKHYGA